MKILIARENCDYINNYRNLVEYLNYSYLTCSDDYDIDECDCLLIPGGADVTPELYGQQPDETVGKTDVDLDKMQLDLIDKFVQKKKPIFGICRGLQLINVYFKGTLIQDLKTDINHKWIALRKDRFHEITNTDYMAEVFTEKCLVNSSHHQAIDKIGNGLIAVSHSSDNVIEAIRHETLPVYAVQWHPERTILTYAKDDLVNGSKLLQYVLNKD